MRAPALASLDKQTASRLAAGVENLLANCLGAFDGERILIVREAPEERYYCPLLSGVVADAATRRGLRVETITAPVLTEAEAPPPTLSAAMAEADHTIFFARIGDQLRFRPSTLKNPPVVSYALDGGMLGSSYGATDHRVFLALKALIDVAVERADNIRITCPLGTNISGRAAPVIGGGDVTVKRFPMPVFRPISASLFSGRVALKRWLVGSGSRFYKPYAQVFDGVVFAEVDAGRIAGFDGPADSVRLIRAHYDRVAGMFGCDADVVHSWHAGIHPGCAFRAKAEADFERWGGGAFGNPRMLHFHTCGDYAPGEICWSVFDATVTFDDVPFWETGRLIVENIPGATGIVAACPEAARLFANPERNIGI